MGPSVPLGRPGRHRTGSPVRSSTVGVFDLVGPWLKVQPQMPQGHEMALPESALGWTRGNVGNQRVAKKEAAGLQDEESWLAVGRVRCCLAISLGLR